ncbi:hypothetical protein GCM10011519_32400 [Marmoricola endophyticus]|uniref:Zinc finger CGNR domain-containing protein n=1 Tax=Marmoricola endophyticus TaxID=2040280 RepID=A0A917BRF8_9ACTN|nr:CGNR zinc finger domain-containing protein [Marmoricola endophyticus]GGF55987.1 hypothetical protein GCM10011519_32400 [Marmoricola endophyticus]
MAFNHDTNVSLQAAAALVNTAEEPETMNTLDDLEAYFTDHEFSGSHDATQAELDQVRAVRPRLRALLTADRDRAAELVNAAMSELGAVPHLVRHSGWDWHLHATNDSFALADRIVVDTALAMIDVIRADELSRLSVCADDDCGGVVVDLSRNRSRKFCSTTCGNRNAVAAYRARQAEADAD